MDDVKLASQMTLEKAFTGPPPRDVSNQYPSTHQQTTVLFSHHYSFVFWSVCCLYIVGSSRIGTRKEYRRASINKTALRSPIAAGPLLSGCTQLQTAFGANSTTKIVKKRSGSDHCERDSTTNCPASKTSSKQRRQNGSHSTAGDQIQWWSNGPQLIVESKTIQDTDSTFLNGFQNGTPIGTGYREQTEHLRWRC